MGGLAEGCCRKEAWTSGISDPAWSNPDNPHAINFPLSTQMQSTGAEALTSQLKCTKGTFLDEAHRFKAGDDLDDPCTRQETRFKKHGFDTIAHRNNPNKPTKMTSVFASCPLFTTENMKTLNA